MKGSMPLRLLLRLFDGYTVSLETKGGRVECCANVIYVTSNLLPRECYPNIDPVHIQALHRRITACYFMGKWSNLSCPIPELRELA